MYKVYRHVINGRNGGEWEDAGLKLARVGESGLKVSASGLKMSGTRCEWMRVGVSGWE